MSLLNFEPSNPLPKGSKKPFKLILGIGALVGTIALGSTLAASINLNSGGPVEFGQGVTQTTSCDSQVEVTPMSSFVNSDGSGDFKFSAITLSDLDGTGQAEATEGCAGKSFTIKTYDSYGAQLQPTYEISVASDGVFSSSSGDTDGTLEGNENSSVTLTFDGSLIDAESVYRITIESEDSTTGPDYWNEVTWTGEASAGPFVFADSLVGSRPTWIDDAEISDSDFRYGFSSNGMGIGGNNGPGFPYLTNFDILSTSKVTIQFHFKYDDADDGCPDHGVIIFPTGTNPDWSWGNTSSGLLGRWNCGRPQLAATTGRSESATRLTTGNAYIGVLTYDPNLLVDQLVLATKELDGTVISLVSLSEGLASGLDYRIAFSADRDDNSGYSYFKNLIITIEPAT